jgi:hypothetical protein
MAGKSRRLTATTARSPEANPQLIDPIELSKVGF